MAGKRMQIADWWIYGFLILLAVCMLLPFVYVIAVSFTDRNAYVPGEFYFLPKKWSLDSYRYILSSNSFINSFQSTVLITLTGTVLNLIFSTSFAYGVTKQDLPGRRFLLTMVLVTMLFGAGMIPNYLLVKELGLIDSLWALILPGLTSAWTIFVMKSFFQSLPDSLEDAAQIDGCNDLMTWWRIILPLSLPMIAAFSLFFAVGQWNLYFAGVIYIQSADKWPLQVLLNQLIIQNQTQTVADLSSMAMDPNSAQLPPETIKMAALVLVMLPILVVYPFLQKYFTKGVLLGSVKG
ncbi:MAG: transporter permease subunit [Paenibacillus sp.]|jgi:putative aldouronate transport system permease protein|nr:transporter permease subunit [Paenibacillus sp.]